MPEYVLSEKAGKLVIDQIGRNITLKLDYSPELKRPMPDQTIPIFPEELDKLCEWWQEAKKLT